MPTIPALKPCLMCPDIFEQAIRLASVVLQSELYRRDADAQEATDNLLAYARILEAGGLQQ
jgi:hypothetical protein